MPPSSTPLPPPAPAPKPPRTSSWSRVGARANSVAGVSVLLVSILVAGGAVGYILSRSATKSPTANTPQITTLSPDEINKLTDLGTSLGGSNQTLNIGANALFRGAVNVGSDLTVGGRFNANGPVTLSQLNITGSTALVGLNVGSNLTVAGTTTLQQNLVVAGQTTVGGNLNVSGTATASALNASSITVTNLTVTGPLNIAHLVSRGATPGISGGSIGAGGTVSISGTDTAGTVNISTGSGTSTGTLATVTFRAAYSGTPHLSLTPLTPAAATLPVFVTRTTGGFVVSAATPPAAGSIYSFDYLVTQ